MMWTLCGIEPTRFVGSILVVSVFAGEVAYGPRVLQVVDAQTTAFDRRIMSKQERKDLPLPSPQNQNILAPPMKRFLVPSQLCPKDSE